MFTSHNGLDRGHNEAETDDVSDRIADIQDRYVRSAAFQDFLADIIEEAEEHLGAIECDVRNITGEDGIDVPELDAILTAARAMHIRRHIPTPDELLTKRETATTEQAQ